MLKKAALSLIGFYRKYISHLKTTKCPYYPTCSTYGLIAVEHHGTVKGSFLTFWRILRCNPFSHGGFDPVPKSFRLKTPFKECDFEAYLQ